MLIKGGYTAADARLLTISSKGTVNETTRLQALKPAYAYTLSLSRLLSKAERSQLNGTPKATRSTAEWTVVKNEANSGRLVRAEPPALSVYNRPGMEGRSPSSFSSLAEEI